MLTTYSSSQILTALPRSTPRSSRLWTPRCPRTKSLPTLGWSRAEHAPRRILHQGIRGFEDLCPNPRCHQGQEESPRKSDRVLPPRDSPGAVAPVIQRVPPPGRGLPVRSVRQEERPSRCTLRMGLRRRPQGHRLHNVASEHL